MAKSSTPASRTARRPRQRRSYDSPMRKAQIDETRARILDAGSNLAHRLKDWDWSKLTAREVARGAKISERTVYRYFATERDLQEAILRRLEEEAGVAYETIAADELLQVTQRIYSSLPKFAATSTSGGAPSASTQRRQATLERVMSELAGEWSDAERRMAAAVIDMLWSPIFYEHLITQWKLDSTQASRTARWAIRSLLKAIDAGARPAR